MPQNHVPDVAALSTENNLDLPTCITAIIDGARQAEDPATHKLFAICPINEEPLYAVQESSPSEVDQAVAAARQAFDHTDWPLLSHNERRIILKKVRDAIEAHADELAAIQTLEVGMPYSGIRAMHMSRTVENFDFFIEVAGTVGGEAYSQTRQYLSVVTREPVGVCALLTPWNAPTVLVSMKLAAALATGNTVVIKASEYSPYSLQRFVQIINDAGLPPGVINLVNGRGHVTGQALVEHPGVDVVGFVGGTATGKAIMSSASQSLKKVGMELGGKSANIVTETANLDTAIDGSLIAILAGNGEQCLAGARILVQNNVADQFIDQFTRRMRAVKVGQPFAPDTEVGPLAFAAHKDKVLSYVDIAKSEGSEVLVGGDMAEGFDKGYYFQPTAVLAKSNQQRVCQEEIFGPFVTIQTYDTLDDAINIANDSDFGLVSYVWSEDLQTVMSASRRIQAGTVWVNTPLTRDLRAPFGGYKQSGVGRDGLHASVELFTEEKTTMFPTSALSLPKLGLPK